MARPTKEPDEAQRRMVKTLASYGVLTQTQIANIANLSEKTLTKWFSSELSQGKDLALTQALNGLFQNIKKGKEASIFFYLKTQHQWKEKSSMELSGVDGAPLTPTINLSIAGKK